MRLVSSCAFRVGVPNFAALAQVRVVPGPVVAVVHVLAKQQVLGIELQSGQNNLRPACEHATQTMRTRWLPRQWQWLCLCPAACAASAAKRQFSYLQPPFGLTSKLPSFWKHAPLVTHSHSRKRRLHAAQSPVLHAEECNTAALENAPHLANEHVKRHCRSM
jgi:hypothetical protein